MVFIASLVSQREHAEHDAGDSHNDRGTEQEWEVHKPLMVGELDATPGSRRPRKVAGVSGLTGKPVVVWPSSAAWANCTLRHAKLPPTSAMTGRTLKPSEGRDRRAG